MQCCFIVVSREPRRLQTVSSFTRLPQSRGDLYETLLFHVFLEVNCFYYASSKERLQVVSRSHAPLTHTLSPPPVSGPSLLLSFFWKAGLSIRPYLQGHFLMEEEESKLLLVTGKT